MATRSPARSARGLRSGRKTRHFRRDGLVLLASEKRTKSPGIQGARLRGYEETLLHAAMARQRILDPRQRQRPVFGRVNDRLERFELGLLRVAAHQDRIAPRGERPDCRLRGGVPCADRFHPDVVGEDHALEAELLLQQPGDDCRRQRSRTLVVDRRNQEVRRHDARNADLDRLLERDQLHRIQAVRRMLDQRQFVMGIGAGVAVTGKMLATGGNAFGLECLDDDRSEPCDVLGRRGERAVADRRVAGIGEDVENRCEVERHAHGAKLGGQRPGESCRERLITAAPERVHGRPHRERRAQAGNPSPFLIDADPQGQFPGQRLRFARHLRDLFRRLDVPGEEDDAAEVELPGERAKVGGDAVPRESGKRDLPRMPAYVPNRHRRII